MLERIHNAINFFLPIYWVNFSNTLGYNTYTVEAKLTDHSLYIENIYDQAGKGRKTAKQFSAITLMNRLCAIRTQIISHANNNVKIILFNLTNAPNLRLGI